MSESTAWVTVPVTPAVKRVIRRAVGMENVTVAEFLRRAALERAARQTEQEAGAAGQEGTHADKRNP